MADKSAGNTIKWDAPLSVANVTEKKDKLLETLARMDGSNETDLTIGYAAEDDYLARQLIAAASKTAKTKTININARLIS